LPQDTLEGIRFIQQQFAALGGWEPLVGGFERILALCLQVCYSVLVLQCFVRGQRRWFWIAVAAHALVDFLVPMAARAGNLLVPELVLALAAAAGFWLILRLREGETKTSMPVEGAAVSGKG
jgi:uncharacterized membrane protein YhfC